MSQFPNYPPPEGRWICHACGVALEQRKVKARYMGAVFDLSIPCCPQCGLYFVPKELAEGKMLEVETILEDK